MRWFHSATPRGQSSGRPDCRRRGTVQCAKQCLQTRANAGPARAQYLHHRMRCYCDPQRVNLGTFVMDSGIDERLPRRRHVQAGLGYGAIIDTTEQASTRSIISALSPMHTRYIHARCMLYTPPLPPTTHASTIPPTRLAYFPSTCSGLPATNLHAQSYPHRLCDTHYHVRVHVSTHHAETHKHTSTDDEACCPLPTPSSPKRKPSIFIRVKLRGRVRRKVKVN